jgi:GTPase SAR1 family protein
MRSVLCPYCLRSQARDELRYRCAPQCAAEPGGLRTFTRQDLSSTGACPHGRHPQARRYCAHCEHPLIREYIDGRHHMIALVGAEGSGKSTLVGVLVHELRHRVGERLGDVAVDLLGEDSRLQYARALQEPLYGDGRTPAPTRPARTRREGRHDPLMIALRWRRRRPLLLLPPVVTTALLVFYDTAGEDLRTSESAEALNEYLRTASGILLTLDTAALLAGPGPDGDPLAALHTVIGHLRELQRLTTPIAVSLTKIDLIQGRDDHFGPGSPLRRESRHVRRFDEGDSLDVHEEIRSWLASRGLQHLDNTLATTLTQYRYFGLSALGQAPRDGAVITSPGIRPYRVEDPLLWLLHGVGAAPSSGGRS